ncbi:MAG: right-handed parallel beta-helix repeat-containing protein, partial [Actinobacteria bacterium]|nr:right-handed parallel beta-helix repeat-containing protein [Actinomycetota bacterium]
MNHPRGIAIDPAGHLYIADNENHRVRVLCTSYLWVGSDPEPVDEGEQFTYDLSVSGLPSTATRVTLTATLPPEVAFSALTTTQGRCTRSGATITCRLGTIDPGETARVLVTVDALAAGTVPISAAVTASNPAAIPGDRTVTAYTRIASADCGRVITSTTTLTADIGPCAGDGVIIGSSNITFDLDGHRVFGFPGPGTGTEAGIRLPAKYRVTVRDGTVSDFDAGVVINRGRANTITGMTIRDNVGPGDVFTAELGDGIVLFDSASNRIVGNVVDHNGVYDGIGVLGDLADNNVIEANTVTDTVGSADRGPAGQGIIVSGAGLDEDFGGPVLLISGTVVRNNIIRGSGSAGIANVNHIKARIAGNVVEDNGATNQAGNGIGLQLGPGAE